MTSYWAELAWLPTGVARSVRFLVEDGRFTAVEPRTRPLESDERLPGMVFPGFANAHGHAFHRALRGRSQSATSMWSWLHGMYAVADRMTPELYLDLARATFAEMLLAGYTLAGDYHYLHHQAGGVPYADPNAMGRVLIRAAQEAGIRFTLLDVCYLAGGLAADGHLPLSPSQQRFADASVGDWADRVSQLAPGPQVRLGAALHSVGVVPKADVRTLVEAVEDIPLHAYVSEQPSDNFACQMHYGVSPVELLADVGALTSDFTAVHATHLSDDDLRLLAEARSQVIACPTSERDLGDGIGRVRDLLDRGVAVSLGSDHHSVIDPFEEMRALEMDERLQTNERGRLTTEALLQAGTRDGYQSLGWYDGGTLSPGSLADFVSVGRESVRTIGSQAGELVYCATAADVQTVVVAGRVVVRDGEHTLGPIAPLLREALAPLRCDR